MGNGSLKRKICVVTGSRADYGILYPVMKAIDASKNLKLYVVATCMHLMKEFGYTVDDIVKDGFKVYRKVDISYRKDSGEAMADSVGRATSKFSEVFNQLNPDIIVVLGDRGEMLAATVAANYLNIPIAHIHGGELSGHIDGTLRHAITKMVHIHFPPTRKARERIIRLGEDPKKIFISGAPSLDRIFNGGLPDNSTLAKKYQLNLDQPFVLLVQHPVSDEIDNAGKRIRETLEVLKKLKLQTMIVYPNADAGGRRMIKVIREYNQWPLFSTFKNIEHKDYLGLLKITNLLVGNSSSGIIEAATFKVPVINIGHRQEGRERSSNVIDVESGQTKIAAAIRRALYDSDFRKKLHRCKNVYGNGRAASRIARVLSTIKLNKQLLNKQITY